PSFALHELSDEFQKSSGSSIARNSACASGDDGHNLAANLFLAAGAIAQHPTAGGDDGDAQALQRARQVSHAAVGATAGLGHAVDGVDEPFAALTILEGDVQDALPAVINHIVGRNVAFVLEHLCDAAIELVIQTLHGAGVVARRV